jgi:phosphate starvation-inducible PhoH-like protein
MPQQPRKPAAPASTTRARVELEFAEPHLLGPLFGEFDRNLVAIEDRLGVYIAARGSGADRGRAEARPAPATCCRASTTGSTKVTISTPAWLTR